MYDIVEGRGAIFEASFFSIELVKLVNIASPNKLKMWSISVIMIET